MIWLNFFYNQHVAIYWINAYEFEFTIMVANYDFLFSAISSERKQKCAHLHSGRTEYPLPTLMDVVVGILCKLPSYNPRNKVSDGIHAGTNS